MSNGDWVDARAARRRRSGPSSSSRPTIPNRRSSATRTNERRRVALSRSFSSPGHLSRATRWAERPDQQLAERAGRGATDLSHERCARAGAQPGTSSPSTRSAPSTSRSATPRPTWCCSRTRRARRDSTRSSSPVDDQFRRRCPPRGGRPRRAQRVGDALGAATRRRRTPARWETFAVLFSRRTASRTSQHRAGRSIPGRSLRFPSSSTLGQLARCTESSCHHRHTSSLTNGSRGKEPLEHRERDLKCRLRRARVASSPSPYARVFTSST